jgi:hypothetical protein
MSPDAEPSWLRFVDEFHCRECGGDEAYRSRPRGFWEKYGLPLLLLQPIRCERCYHRFYILRTIPVLERAQSSGKDSTSERPAKASSDGGVA